MEALTGEGALEYARNLRSQVNALAQEFKTTPAMLLERIRKIQEMNKKMEKELAQGGRTLVEPDEILSQTTKIKNVNLASFIGKGLQTTQLRFLSDALRSRGKSLVYFLGTEDEEKIQFLIGMSPDLHKSSLDMRELSQALSALLDASGGGRKDLVQGGSRNRGQFSLVNREKIQNCAVDYLNKKGS
jgi:alanyl-tRNA synthetase